MLLHKHKIMDIKKMENAGVSIPSGNSGLKKKLHNRILLLLWALWAFAVTEDSIHAQELSPGANPNDTKTKLIPGISPNWTVKAQVDNTAAAVKGTTETWNSEVNKIPPMDTETKEMYDKILGMEAKYADGTEASKKLNFIIPEASSVITTRLLNLRNEILPLMEMIRTERKVVIQCVIDFLTKKVQSSTGKEKTSANMDLSWLMELENNPAQQLEKAKALSIKYKIVLKHSTKTDPLAVVAMREASVALRGKGDKMLKTPGLAIRGQFLVDTSDEMENVLGLQKSNNITGNENGVDKNNGQENLARKIWVKKWKIEGATVSTNVQAVLDEDKDRNISIKTIGTGYYSIVLPIKWNNKIQTWKKVTGSFKIVSEDVAESTKMEIIPKAKWVKRPSLWSKRSDGVVSLNYTIAEWDNVDEVEVRVHNSTDPKGGQNTVIIRDISVIIE